jgi:hypothetical protein
MGKKLRVWGLDWGFGLSCCDGGTRIGDVGITSFPAIAAGRGSSVSPVPKCKGPGAPGGTGGTRSLWLSLHFVSGVHVYLASTIFAIVPSCMFDVPS